MGAKQKASSGTLVHHDPVVMAELVGAAGTAIAGTTFYLTHHYLYLAALVALAAWVVFWLSVLSPRAMRKNRTRTLRWRAKMRLRPAKGYASTAQLALDWSRFAAIGHGRRARPDLSLYRRLTLPTTEFGVRLGRAQYGKRVYSRMEDQVARMAPQRVGKTGVMADRVADHPGGVLTTSTRPDLYHTTLRERAAMGRVQVFNPQGIGDVPSTLRWDLLGACKDLMGARRMASWLTGASTIQGNLEWFAKKGEVALGGLLYAAANLPGATVADVFRWVQRDGYELAFRVLAENRTPELLAVVRQVMEDNRTAGSVRDTIELALSWAAVPELAQAVTPLPGDPGLDVADLALGGGTLHLVASGDENSPITPVFRAIASYVHYEAGMIGTRQPKGKLSPPMLMAMDEVAVVCPVDLPGMLADSAGKGILMDVVFHSVSQLEDKWGPYGAQTIWACCGTKMLLPGISSDTTLESVSRLCGEAEHEDRETRIVPVALLRTLPDNHALIVRMNLDPVIVSLRPVWKRASRRWPTRYFARQLRPAYATIPGIAEAVDVPAVTATATVEIDDRNQAEAIEPATTPGGEEGQAVPAGPAMVPAPRADEAQAPNEWPSVNGYDPARH